MFRLDTDTKPTLQRTHKIHTSHLQKGQEKSIIKQMKRQLNSLALCSRDCGKK